MRSLIVRLQLHGKRIAAGGALLVGLLLVVVVLSGGSGSYEMKAQFDDVRGLIPGGSVRAGAVDVGSVQKVELKGALPVVTMRISDDFKLHRGATADIQLFSNAGAVNRTIELTSGDPTAPELSSDTVLRSAQTDQPVNFDDAAETLDEPTRANIKSFLGGLDKSLKGRGKDFDRTLRHSAAAVSESANLLAQVNSDSRSLKTLVAQGSRVTEALAASPGDLASAADSTAALLQTTAKRQNELSRSVQLFGPALSRGRVALASLAAATPRLRRLVVGLGPVADDLGPFARALPPALRAAGPFLAETRRLVKEAPANLSAFAPIIASAHKVAPQLASLIDNVLPLGNTLRAYIPETVGFFQNLGSTIGSYDANGHMINMTGAVTYAPPSSTSSTVRTASQCGAGAVSLPFIRTPGALECQPWEDYESSSIGVPAKTRKKAR